jgi:hypothetical protein
MACRTLQAQNITVAILTETRLPANPDGVGIHTRSCLGYTIFATYTTTQNQGGIALAFQENNPSFLIESPVRHGPNVLSCLLVTGGNTTPVIGAYLPPLHLDDLPFLVQAFAQFPNTQPLLLGDLNVDLSYPHATARIQQVSALLATYGMEDMLQHFQQRKRHRNHHTWHQLCWARTLKTPGLALGEFTRELFATVLIYWTSGECSSWHILLTHLVLDTLDPGLTS